MDVIDKNITDNEVCIRCIISPRMWNEKNRKVKPSAFLPPINDNRVSLMRLRYCSQEFINDYASDNLCRNNAVYVGFAELMNSTIKETNDWAQSEESKLDGVDGVNGVSAKLIASPMHNGKYVANNQVVYIDDPNVDLFMHADLEYSDFRQDEPATKLRNYSAHLLKKVNKIVFITDN